MRDPEPSSTPHEPPTQAEILDAPHRWYHTIELSPGVTTPGWVDLRPVVDVAGFPADLGGQRAVDLGTFDGFWAFELERRGAHVTALDIDEIPPPDAPRATRDAIRAEAGDDYPGLGFELLARWFGSRVERIACNVYDLTPDRIGGSADLIFCGALLLHLRDPVRALEAAYDTLRPGGTLILVEPVDRRVGRRRRVPAARFQASTTAWTWWRPNEACLKAWITTAGFGDVDVVGRGRAADRDTRNSQDLVGLHARRA